MTLPLPTAGLHYGIPYEDYAAWPAINFSKLKPILGTASKCKYEMDNPKKPTAAMTLGSALHVATLEPGRFESLFYICPASDLRTTEGKKIFAEHREKAGARAIIRSGTKDDDKTGGENTPISSVGQIELLQGMAKSIRGLKSTARFLDGAGFNEVSMLWKDEEFDLWCKARVDRMQLDFEKFNRPLIVELKTARDASDFWFSKDIDSRNYDAQAASYRHGLQMICGKSAIHVFIAVENFAPYDAAVYMPDDHSLQTGLLKYRHMLKLYAQCVKSGKWPGYPDKVQTIGLPGYANERTYAD